MNNLIITPAQDAKEYASNNLQNIIILKEIELKILHAASKNKTSIPIEILTTNQAEQIKGAGYNIINTPPNTAGYLISW